MSRGGFLARLKERTRDRDKAISLTSYFAQLKAIHRWGLARPQGLSVIRFRLRARVGRRIVRRIAR
ncbi:hypothetical protein [Streptomyces sp. 2A115]|uniref:hypothetical protein n=1 Tax=Streptomyces sp. 2A115 TaxID=3457439 RepID=UPI003FD5A78C